MSWSRLVFFATVVAALAAWLARSPEGGTSLECVLVTQEAGMEERGVNTLKVVTLNTWGLWLASKKRRRRMDCLAQYLSKTAAVGGALLQQHGSAAATYWAGLWAGCSLPCPPASRLPAGRSHTKQPPPPIAGVQDVVVLQEVWVHDDVALLREHAARGPLRHAAHFQGGAIGAGLVVLSRHPILEVGPQAGDGPAAVCGRCPVFELACIWEEGPVDVCVMNAGQLAVCGGHSTSSRRPRCWPSCLQVGFHPFAARGDPFRVLNGDFFAGLLRQLGGRVLVRLQRC